MGRIAGEKWTRARDWWWGNLTRAAAGSEFSVGGSFLDL